MFNSSENKNAIVDLINYFILHEQNDKDHDIDHLLVEFDQSEEVVQGNLKWFKN